MRPHSREHRKDFPDPQDCKLVDPSGVLSDCAHNQSLSQGHLNIVEQSS